MHQVEHKFNPQGLHQIVSSGVCRLQNSQGLLDENLLEKEHAIHRNSSLLQLRPFLSEDGLLKVGGRLKHANIPISAKHQIILPGKSWVSRMLVQHYHQKDAEVGLNHMMASLRLRYWIVGCRALVKGFLRSCFLCTFCQTNP